MITRRELWPWDLLSKISPRLDARLTIHYLSILKTMKVVVIHIWSRAVTHLVGSAEGGNGPGRLMTLATSL